MRKLQLAGRRFGRWLVLEAAPKRQGIKYTFWSCLCDCGVRRDVNADSLVRGASKSCGCLSREVVRARSLKHGNCLNRGATKEYKAWSHAKARCYCESDAKFPIYGGRGIKMCDSWLNDFSVFLQDMGTCPTGLTLDRIDVNGNYEPSNCRWATAEQQANNKRNNIFVTLGNKKVTLKQYALHYRLNYPMLHHYTYKRGLSLAEAVLMLASV